MYRVIAVLDKPEIDSSHSVCRKNDWREYVLVGKKTGGNMS